MINPDRLRVQHCAHCRRILSGVIYVGEGGRWFCDRSCEVAWRREQAPEED